MYRIELTLKDGTIKVFPNLFNEDTIDTWKYKDNWIESIDTNEYKVNHRKVELIRNKDDKVLVSKEFKNKSRYTSKDPFQYYSNKIYDTVKKDIGLNYYKKDEYNIPYVVLTSNGKYIGYCEICNEIEGSLCDTESKAFTAIKKRMHKHLIVTGLNTLIKNNKRKK